MNTQTRIIVEEYKKKLGGYLGMLMYRYANLVVKAEPISLLSTTVVSEEGIEKIEDVVTVVPGDDDFTLRLYPNDNDKIFPLVQGLLREHPEYGVKCLTADTNEEAKFPDDNDRRLYLLLSAPEVDKDRRKLLRDSTNTLYHSAEGNIELNSKDYQARIMMLAKDEPAKEVDDLKDELEEIHNMHMDRIDEMREKKLKEIEDGYIRYQNNHLSNNKVDDSDLDDEGDGGSMTFE